MLRFACALMFLSGCAACSPSLNWREVAVGATGLKATLPCKPATAERRIPVAPGREWVVHATGCEAGGATFAVLYADVDAAELPQALPLWRAASLATLHEQSTSEKSYLPAGALALPGSGLVAAQGQRPDGTALQSQAAYFGRGARVFQAAVHSRAVTAEMAEPFFAGLRFE